MNTPNRDFARRTEFPRRRSSRQALAVIPDAAAAAAGGSPDVLTPDGNGMNNTNNRYSIDSWSPAPSPDEQVIQKRGRRRRTIVWSPDVNACKRDSLFSLSSRERTPVKSPTKTSMTLRSTPRKRLVLGDSNEPSVTPLERKKKSIAQYNTEASASLQNLLRNNVDISLRCLDNDKLVDVIMTLVSMQERGILSSDDNIRDILLQSIPQDDVKMSLEKLHVLRKNVLVACESCDNNEASYSLVYSHLEQFQKGIEEESSRYLESGNFKNGLTFAFAAWELVKNFPKLMTDSPEIINYNCWNSLALCIEHALRHGHFETSVLNAYYERLQVMLKDHQRIKTSLQLIEDIKLMSS